MVVKDSDVWRFNMEDNGEQSAMMAGIWQILTLCVVSWDSQMQLPSLVGLSMV